MMKRRISLIVVPCGIWCILGAVIFFPACGAPKQAMQVVIRDTPRILTLGIDSRDYDEMVSKLAEDLLSRPELQKLRGRVLGLGPIDDNDCLFRFNVVTFQDQLAIKLQRSEQVVFSEVINTMKADSATAALREIKYFDWERKTTDDKELLAIVGDLAKVDFLLFGRLSCEVATNGDRVEVTYRFNWKIMELKTGLWVWAWGQPRTKEGKLTKGSVPDWVAYPRGNNAMFHYQIGHATGARSPEEARLRAIADARSQIAQQLNTELNVSDDQVVTPVNGDEIGPEPVPQAEVETNESGGTSCWLMVRLPRKAAMEVVGKRKEVLGAWVRLEQAFEQARHQADAGAKGSSLRECAAGYAALAATYPLEAQRFVQTELVMLREAEVEQERGYPCTGARRKLEDMSNKTTTAAWKAKAREMITKLACDDAAEKAEALKREFDGKTVAVVAAKKVGQNSEVWRELQSALESKLRSVGVTPQGGLPVTPEQAVAWTLGGAKIPEIVGADMVWLVCADGEVVKGEPDPDGGIYYFDGELRGSLVTKDKVLTLLADKGRVGRNFPDERMCLGSLLANAVAKRCLEKYSEKPVQANKP